jgi:hypothetical protein
VDHQELPLVHDPLEAINSNAPIAYESLRSYVDLHIWLADIPNIHSFVELQNRTSRARNLSNPIRNRDLPHRGATVNYLEPRAVVVQVDSS